MPLTLGLLATRSPSRSGCPASLGKKHAPRDERADDGCRQEGEARPLWPLKAPPSLVGCRSARRTGRTGRGRRGPRRATRCSAGGADGDAAARRAQRSRLPAGLRRGPRVVGHGGARDAGVGVHVADAEEEVRRRPVMLAVDDVTDTSDCYPEREGGGDGVQSQTSPSQVPGDGRRGQDQAPVEGEAARPDPLRGLQELARVGFQRVEQAAPTIPATLRMTPSVCRSPGSRPRSRAERPAMIPPTRIAIAMPCQARSPARSRWSGR